MRRVLFAIGTSLILLIPTAAIATAQGEEETPPKPVTCYPLSSLVCHIQFDNDFDVNVERVIELTPPTTPLI